MPTNKEYYDELIKDTSRYETNIYFYFENKIIVPNNENKLLYSMINELKKYFVIIGPMHKDYVEDKKYFYNIPLARKLSKDIKDEYIGFMSTNKNNAISLRYFYDILRNLNSPLFSKLNLSIILTHRATNKEGRKVVMLITYLDEIKLTHYFEHPLGIIPQMTLFGNDIVDSSLLLFGGKTKPSINNIINLNMLATNLYNDYDLGNISEDEFQSELYNVYKPRS